MATIKQIQFKRSTASGTKPAVAQLAEGELAINLADRTLFTKDHNNQIIDLGFAKGGTINGDVIQIGNYKQTGQYTLTGNIDASGDITSHGRVWTHALMIRPLDQGASFIIENHSNVSKDLRIIAHSTGELPTDYDRLLFRSINDTNVLDPMSISWSKNSNETVVDVYGKLNSRNLLTANKAVITNNSAIDNVLGDNSIALGDNDTGFKWWADGHYNLVSNGVVVLSLNQSESSFLRTTHFQYSADGWSTTIVPENASLIQVSTEKDDNNIGDGLTYLGLNQGGKYSHYLRGSGTTFIDTLGGLRISTSVSALKGISTEGKGTGDYDSYSLVNWDESPTTSINHLRQFRAYRTGSIIHELFSGDSITPNALSWFTGYGPDVWMASLHTDGSFKINGTLETNAAYEAFNIKTRDGAPAYIRGANNNETSWLMGRVITGSNEFVIRANNLAGQTMVDLVSSPDDKSFAINIDGNIISRFKNDVVTIDGSRWAAIRSHLYREQWAYDAPLTVDMGRVTGQNDYYPAFSQKSIAANAGFNTKVEFGTLRLNNTWGQGIIRVGTFGYQPDADRQGIFTFTLDGDFQSQRYVIAPHFLTGVSSSAHPNKPGITIGDNDTGIYWGGDGIVAHFANNIQVAVLDSTGFRTEGGRSLVSNGDLNQANDAHSTYVRDIYIRSDIRVKSELRKFESPSETLKKMNGYLYLQKKGFKEDGSINWEQSSGLIAQEVQAVLPELISVDKDNPEGLLRLNYNGIIALNTATINEHTDEISELKARIQKLEEIISTLI